MWITSPALLRHIAKKKSTVAAEKLFDDFIIRFGIPSRIHHDEGCEFDNQLFHCLEKNCGVKCHKWNAASVFL